MLRFPFFFLFIFIFAFGQSVIADEDDLTVRVIGSDICNDGVDNDGDEFIDYGDDPGCESGTDTDEYNAVGGGGGVPNYNRAIISSGPLINDTKEEEEETPIDIPNSIIVSGYAYPNSEVSLLQNGVVVGVVTADVTGQFEIRLLDLETGIYVFGISALDADNKRSVLQTFSIEVTDKVTTVVDGVFLPPTISTDKIEVRRGSNINFFGRAVPNSAILININPEQLEQNLFSDGEGKWSAIFNTSRLEYGDHLARAASKKPDGQNKLSPTISFYVSDKNILTVPLAGNMGGGDMNGDGRVNLTDFSIAAFWYHKDNPERGDLNGDAKVDLVDLSILAYYWTG